MPLTSRITMLTTSKTKKMMNKIFAIVAAVPAMPPNPKAAARMASTRKTMIQVNTVVPQQCSKNCLDKLP